MAEKVVLSDKFKKITEYWSPKIVGELNGQHVKLAKVKGEFVWHSHREEDEMFYVVKGVLTIEFRDRKVVLRPGEFLIVPKGVEHRPVAVDEVELLLFEPASTINTGEVENELTKKELGRI